MTTATSNIGLNMQTVKTDTGDSYMLFTIAHGMVQTAFMLNLAALDTLIENLPEARAALHREVVGLVVAKDMPTPRKV